MHVNGVTCPETKAMIQDISRRVQQLAEETPNTLFIITADHGMIDIEGDVNLYEDTKLYDMLEIYPYMEPRAIAFKVKQDKKTEFAEYFTSKIQQRLRTSFKRRIDKKGIFWRRRRQSVFIGRLYSNRHIHSQASAVCPCK